MTATMEAMEVANATVGVTKVQTDGVGAVQTSGAARGTTVAEA